MTSLADRLNVDFGIIHREVHGEDDVHTLLSLIGQVKGKICFILDDIIDNANSFLDTAEHLMRCEAEAVFIVCTHGIFSGSSLADIENCEAVQEVDYF